MKKPLKIKRSVRGICRLTGAFKATLKPRNLSIMTSAVSLAAVSGYLILGPPNPDNMLRDLLRLNNPFIDQVQAQDSVAAAQEFFPAHTVSARGLPESAQTDTDHTDPHDHRHGHSHCRPQEKAAAELRRQGEAAAENQRHQASLQKMSPTARNNSVKMQEETVKHTRTLAAIEEAHHDRLSRLHCE